MAKEVVKTSKKAAEPEAPKGGKKAAEKPKGPKMLGSKEVAAQLGINPAALRRYLRAQGKGIKASGGDVGRYEWAEGSLEIIKLGKAYAAHQEEVAKKRKEQGEKLAGGAKKGKKKGKKSRVEEDTEEFESEEGGEAEGEEEIE